MADDRWIPDGYTVLLAFVDCADTKLSEPNEFGEVVTGVTVTHVHVSHNQRDDVWDVIRDPNDGTYVVFDKGLPDWASSLVWRVDTSVHT